MQVSLYSQPGVRFGAKQPERPSQPAAASAPETKKKKTVYQEPTPSKGTMRLASFLNRSLLLFGVPGLRHVPVINKIPLVNAHFNIKKVDLPETDFNALRGVINEGTAAFVGPNHPEFMTDWVLDKYLSDLLMPEMAGWAASSVVAGPLKNFWLKNNVIANDGGKEAEEYSINWALKGKGVLLHPEGTVRWTGNKINQLFPGISDMAVEAAKRSVDGNMNRPVFVTPIVWKLRFTKDVSKALLKEMRWIEKNLDLPQDDNNSVAWRFYALQNNVLSKQMQRMGYQEPEALKKAPYFERAEKFLEWIYQDMSSRYAIKQDGTLDQRIHRLFKAVNDAKKKAKADAAQEGRELDKESPEQKTLRQDGFKADEMKRLRCFTRDLYGTRNTLSQEEVAESLKLIRQFLGKGPKEQGKAYLPKPVGPRVAHIRSVTPVEVTARLREAREKGISEEVLSRQILEEVRNNMQSRLDALNTEIEPEVKPHRLYNPFYIPVFKV